MYLYYKSQTSLKLRLSDLQGFVPLPLPHPASLPKEVAINQQLPSSWRRQTEDVML